MAFFFLFSLSWVYPFSMKHLLKGWNMSHVSKNRRKIWRTTLFACFGYFENKWIKDILMKFYTCLFIYDKRLFFLFHILMASPTYSRWSCIHVRFYWLVECVLVGECLVCLFEVVFVCCFGILCIPPFAYGLSPTLWLVSFIYFSFQKNNDQMYHHL